MKTFNKLCAQGDIMIIRIDSLPEDKNLKAVDPVGKDVIVTHSETGHHHVMDAEKVTMFENKDQELECFLTVHREAELTHKRDVHTHESILFAPGNYKVVRQREYTPQGYRRVAD